MASSQQIAARPVWDEEREIQIPDIESGKRKDMDLAVNENLKVEIKRKQAEMEEAWKSEHSMR